jgi:hypothetical protein
MSIITKLQKPHRRGAIEIEKKRAIVLVALKNFRDLKWLSQLRAVDQSETTEFGDKL